MNYKFKPRYINDAHLSIRCTQEEKDKIRQMAEKKEMSMNEYVLFRTLGHRKGVRRKKDMMIADKAVTLQKLTNSLLEEVKGLDKGILDKTGFCWSIESLKREVGELWDICMT